MVVRNLLNKLCTPGRKFCLIPQIPGSLLSVALCLPKGNTLCISFKVFSWLVVYLLTLKQTEDLSWYWPELKSKILERLTSSCRPWGGTWGWDWWLTPASQADMGLQFRAGLSSVVWITHQRPLMFCCGIESFLCSLLLLKYSPLPPNPQPPLSHLCPGAFSSDSTLSTLIFLSFAFYDFLSLGKGWQARVRVSRHLKKNWRTVRH